MLRQQGSLKNRQAVRPFNRQKEIQSQAWEPGFSWEFTRRGSYR